MNRNRNIISGLDWLTIVLFFVIALFGWMNIYGAGYSFEQTEIWNFSNRAGKQLVWLIGAVVIGVIVLCINEKTYDVLAYILYAGMLILLAITPLVAHNIKGSYSWIAIGPFRLQTAEFAKCFTALAIAKYMGRFDYRLRDWRDMIIPLLLILAPMMVIMVAQRETGTALIFLAFFLVFYRFGMSGDVLLLGVISALLFVGVLYWGGIALPWGEGNVGCLATTLLIEAIVIIALLFRYHYPRAALFVVGGVAVCYAVGLLIKIWLSVDFDIISVVSLAYTTVCLGVNAILKRNGALGWLLLFVVLEAALCQGGDFVFQKVLQPHQRKRIEVLLGMRDDPTGAGYNVNQSLIAIGSGQLTGKGYLQGTQTKLRFVPEQDTDFIFCTVGEEWGFVGSAGLLLLYLFLILRIVYIAERQRDKFSMIYAYCVACILLFHVMINIGMVLGLLPVIGIPLPLFSYGGSSLWGFTLLLAILLRLDAARVNKLQ